MPRLDISIPLRTSQHARRLLLAVPLLICTTFASAETVTVAVAANFQAAMEQIADAFERRTQHKVRLVSGSTGQLYAQIVRAAPYDIFLAADTERPNLLVQSGLAERDSQFTYARGRLALWSRERQELRTNGLSVLNQSEFRHLVIANPDLAPYGRAAKQTLESLGLWAELESRLAYGQSIGQTFALAATQTAELGFVALSQAAAYPGDAAYVLVPESLHEPILQDAVLLTRSIGNIAAVDILNFLMSDAVAEIVKGLGYDPGD